MKMITVVLNIVKKDFKRTLYLINFKFLTTKTRNSPILINKIGESLIIDTIFI